MIDWRSNMTRATLKHDQISGEGAKDGLFSAYISSSSGETQSGNFVYAGGERSIPLPMPFESSNSWIRAIPEAGSPALAGYRSDIQDVVCINYYSTNPLDKLTAYGDGLNIYRPLQPGEIEVSSTGMAQSYYSQRPVVEHRGGLVRSWLDQDRLESGAKAPLHARLITGHASNVIGDEERFGVVRRPYNFVFDPSDYSPRDVLTAILALSPTSSNYYDYPYPNFTIPGPVPVVNVATLAATQEAAADATAVALTQIGEFEQRVFAKESLKVMLNPLYPASPNQFLIDHREGQVFDNYAQQTISGNGTYLRARYQYFSPTLDATVFDIDEVGNVDVTLSIGATSGYNIVIPTGGFSVECSLQGIDLTTLANDCTIFSGLSTGITAGTDFSVDTVADVSFDCGVDFSIDVAGDYDVSILGDATIDAALNYEVDAGVDFTAKAVAGTMTLFAPQMEIGFLPTSQMVLGNELNAFLLQFLNAFIAAGPALTTGNLGAPTPINPALLTVLTSLQSLLTGGPNPPQNPWLSKTIKVSI